MAAAAERSAATGVAILVGFLYTVACPSCCELTHCACARGLPRRLETNGYPRRGRRRHRRGRARTAPSLLFLSPFLSASFLHPSIVGSAFPYSRDSRRAVQQGSHAERRGGGGGRVQKDVAAEAGRHRRRRQVRALRRRELRFLFGMQGDGQASELTHPPGSCAGARPGDASASAPRMIGRASLCVAARRTEGRPRLASASPPRTQ